MQAEIGRSTPGRVILDVIRQKKHTMGYYSVGEHHVFMTDEREAIAKEKALADKEAFFRIRMAFDSPEHRQGEKLIDRFLESEYNSDPEQFIEEWVKFDFNSEDAVKYGWDLLFDYCCITKAARLVELRSEHAQMMGDLTNDNFANPMGNIFRLEALSQGWFFRRPTFGVTVNLNKIRSIKGIPSNFVVRADGLTLVCASQITAS